MILAHFLLCLHLLYKALLEKVLWLCTKNNWNHWKYLLINPVSKLFYAMSLSDLFVWNSLPIFSSEKKKANPLWQVVLPRITTNEFSHYTGYAFNEMLCSLYREVGLLLPLAFGQACTYSWSIFCNFQGQVIKGNTIPLGRLGMLTLIFPPPHCR